MIQLIYASAAKQPFSTEELRQLLVRSRVNNEKLGVSGMLVYHGGDFLQLLEGPEEAVLGVFSKVSSDTRHNVVKLVSRTPIKVRYFADWSMGFADTSEIPPNVDGYVTLTTAFSEMDQTRATHALRWFQNGTWHSVAA